jgi:predicted phosphodiesterase
LPFLFPFSDIHLDFYDRNEIAALLKQVACPGGVEPAVLVIAGDLGTIREQTAQFAIPILCGLVESVVFVCGNHEYYGSDPEEVHHELASLNAALPNFHWLHCSSADINGTRFAGATLWFPRPAPSIPWLVNDRRAIRGFEPWVYEENARATEFLREAVAEVDVVVTHHVPTYQAVAPEYQGSLMNVFFVCPMDSEIASGSPPLWIFGHTHKASDITLGRTRLVCNPYGYPSERRRSGFHPHLFLELPRRNTGDSGETKGRENPPGSRHHSGAGGLWLPGRGRR